jgi:glycosyltransferase involved in cell wall biosynthesis
MKVTLLVPTWNEIDGMRKIMPLVKPEWYDQILILDGGSVDGTIEYAKEHGYEVYVQKKKGFRNGYTEIWPMVKGDIVVTFSPDGNSLPEAIPQMVAKMKEGYDMVIASRYLGSAKSEDDDFMTGFGNWLFTKIINVLHGGHYTDSMVILRAYRTNLVKELELEKDEGFVLAERLFSTNISWEPLLSVRAAKRKLRVTEIPADEPPRIGGVRKLQVFRWGAAFLVQFVREVFVWK